MRLAHALDEPDRAPHLLLGVDLGAGSGLDAADVHDLGAEPHDLRHPVEGLVLRPGRALVVEGVRGPVDDRHHQPPVVAEGVPTQPQRHGADPPTTGRTSTDGGRSVSSIPRTSVTTVRPSTRCWWRPT